MIIESLKVGILDTNCYVLGLDDKVLVIDPGDDFDKILQVIGNRNVAGIIITHYHFDHIGALDDLREKTRAKVFDRYNLKEGINKIWPFEFECIYTPGHKEDLITIYFEEYNAMFCGDFIFEGTIGRCDLDGGDFRVMKKSIAKILNYPDDVIIYPGHGNFTSLKNERKNLSTWI